MSAHVLPFGPSQAAELADDCDRKRSSTASARCALLGIPLKSITMPDGQIVYSAGMHKFGGIEQLENWLDRIRDSE